MCRELAVAFQHRATRYDERVTFYAPARGPTVNDDGGVEDAGDEICVRWVKIRPVRGGERELGLQTVADVTHLVRLPKDAITATLNPSMWLVRADGNRLNVVRGYELEDQPRVMELECRERAGA